MRVFPPLILDTWWRGRGRVHMALSDLSGHARPSHSACTSTQVMRPSVAHGAGLGAVLFPPAPGVVRMYFVWEVRPYWAAFGLSHTNCMGFSAIRFVWPNICIFPKVDRGWQNYFAYSKLQFVSFKSFNNKIPCYKTLLPYPLSQCTVLADEK